MAKMILDNGREIRLRLVKSSDRICLQVVGVDGVRLSSGSLMTLERTGIFTKHTSVSSEFGLVLDGLNSIRVER